MFDHGRGTAIVYVEVARPSAWVRFEDEDLDALSPSDFLARASSLEADSAYIVEDAPLGQARLVRALPWFPVLEVEITEAGLEYLRHHSAVVRIHAAGTTARPDADFGRLSSIRTADRMRVEESIRTRGKAKVVVQLRRLERPAKALARSPRADRLFTQRHDVLGRISGPTTKVARNLGTSHLELIVDAQAFEALLLDPEVIAIAAPPQ